MMSLRDHITFVSHTSKPGGGELALRRYLEATSLPVRLVTMEPEGVWEGLAADVAHAPSLLALRGALQGEEIVVANSMRAAFLTALVLPPRTQLVYWARDGLTASAMSPLALWLTRHVTARRVTHYLANSEWTAGTVREALHVDPASIDVVHSMCGVTDEVLQRPPRLAPHDPLRLLFLGRISPWKAPDVAVEALACLEEEGIRTTLTVAGAAHFGEDEYAAKLRGTVNPKAAVTFTGHVDDVQGLLESHDILVHCSTVPEPFGQVIVQAIAAKLPVVATDAGGPQRTLGGAPVPLLYEPGNKRALSRRVVEVLARYAEVSSWCGERAREYEDVRLVGLADYALTQMPRAGAKRRGRTGTRWPHPGNRSSA